MTDDVLTFEELRQVQNRARESDTLQELDESFFGRAQNYLEVKQEGDDHLQAQEYRNAKNIVQDILDLRQKKIVKLAFLSVKSDVTVENMLSHEEELFEELENAIGEYREERHKAVFDNGQAVTDELPVDDEEEPEEEAAEAPEEQEETEDEDGEEAEEPEETEEEDEDGEDEETDELLQPEETEEEDGEEDAAEDEAEEEEEDGDSSEVADILEFESEEDEEGSEAEEGGEGSDEGEEEPVDSSDDDEPPETDDGKVLMETQERVPEFMGTDLNAYGPFEEGEEVAVPEENADVLEQQGKAERV